MDDFLDRLKKLERNALPDLWDDIRSRAESPPSGGEPRRWPAFLVAGVMGLVGVVAGFVGHREVVPPARQFRT